MVAKAGYSGEGEQAVGACRPRWRESSSNRRRVSGAVLVAFALLFPGYFVYWLLVGIGVIPRFLGGYAVLMSAVCVVGSLPFLWRGRMQMCVMDVLVGAFIILMAIYALWGMATGAPADVSKSYVAYVLQWSAMFVVFRGLVHLDSRCSFVVLSAFFVMLFSLGGFLSTGSLIVEDDPVMAEIFPTYQAFAVHFVVCASLVLASINTSVVRMACLLLSLAFLVVLGARSELVLFMVLVVFAEAFRGGLAGASVAYGSMLLGVAIAVIFADGLASNRIVYWVTEWLEHGALNTDAGRTALNQLGLEVIAEHPILGSYGYYSEGAYAHNVLSVWAELGLVPFVLYCVTFILAGWVIFRSSKRFTDRSLWAAVCGLYAGTLLVLLTTKSFGYQLVPVVLGFASGFLRDHGNESVRQSMTLGKLSRYAGVTAGRR